MPKQGQRAEVNTFIQGLITEASPLNFPPNASKEEENFELFRDGTRRRRKGLKLENGHHFRTVTPSEVPTGDDFSNPPAFTTYVWKSVEGQLDLDVLVVQNGNTLDFFNVNLTAPTTNNYLGSLNTIVFDKRMPLSYAALEGKLVVVGGYAEVLVISYAAGVFTRDYRTLLVRDLWGMEITRDYQAESDYYYHPNFDESSDFIYGMQLRYNLDNQSWGVPRRVAGGTFADPISYYKGDLGYYPSMAEVVSTGLAFKAVEATVSPYEQLYTNVFKESYGLSAIAAKGYFIIDALRRGTSRKAAFQRNLATYPTLLAYDSRYVFPADTTSGGATAIAAYAGRIFFTGFSGTVTGGDARSPNLNNYIFFSQLVRSSPDINKCYQEGDPTSRDGADVVDTDGGFIKVTGATDILDIQSIGTHLVVLADNGIWAVTGGAEYGFTASNYKVAKISSYGCTSKSSIVLEGESVVYWGDGGIYSIAKDQYGSLQVTSLSQTTIQSFYDDIPQEARNSARGVYDMNKKKIRWVYRSGTMFSPQAVTKELVLDFALGNFSLNTIKRLPDNNLEVISPIMVTNISEVGYITYGKNVVTSGETAIYCGYSISYYSNDKFLDWEEMNGVGVDAKAFMLTGSQIAGDSAVHKQIPYIVMHFEKTETDTNSEAIPNNQSSCLVNFYWDWANNTNSNKVSSLQQAYKYRKALLATPSSLYDNGFEVVTSKTKIRGRGRSFALYLETEPKKDCHVLGWNLTLNGDSVA